MVTSFWGRGDGSGKIDHVWQERETVTFLVDRLLSRSVFGWSAVIYRDNTIVQSRIAVPAW